MAHDIFISYATEDKAVADAVCLALEDKGIRCWYAPRDVPYAVNYEEAIIDAISESRLILLILSSRSNDSLDVKREIQNACREEPPIPVLPFQIEDVPLNKALKYYIGSVQRLIALTPPLEDHLQRLVESIRARLSPLKQASQDTENNVPRAARDTEEKLGGEAKETQPRPVNNIFSGNTFADFVKVLAWRLTTSDSPKSNSLAEANKLVQEGNKELQEIDRIADDNEQKMDDLDKADKDGDTKKVKSLLEDLMKTVDNILKHGEIAADKLDQASKMKVDDKYKEYLSLKSQSLRKQVEAFKERKEAVKIMHDNYDNTDKTAMQKAKDDFKKKNSNFKKLLGDAKDLSRKADDIARENPNISKSS
jgi:hypothetical protein